MQIWVPARHDTETIVRALKMWKPTKVLYHNVVQDYINSRFPCMFGQQTPLYIDVKNNIITILDEPTCVICQSDGLVFKTLPCGHHFHRGCVQQWLRKNPTCPLCRAPTFS